MSNFTDELIREMPIGVERGILRILSFHQGKKQAIGRGRVVAELVLMGYHVSEREMRACINELRKEGHLICSMGGEGGGSYLPADHEELEEYIERELHPRAMDMLEQEKALRAEAEKRWGRYSPEKQVPLF